MERETAMESSAAEAGSEASVRRTNRQQCAASQLSVSSCCASSCSCYWRLYGYCLIIVNDGQSRQSALPSGSLARPTIIADSIITLSVVFHAVLSFLARKLFCYRVYWLYLVLQNCKIFRLKDLDVFRLTAL